MTAYLPIAAQGAGGAADPASLVNYSFAVSDTAFSNVVGQSVQVVRLPISYTLRSLDDHSWGAKLHFPISFGLHEFQASDPFGGDLSEQVATVTGMAGIEFQIPAGARWMLKPFAELGAGTDLDDSETAWIYSAGLSGVMQIPREKVLYRVGIGLAYDGATLASGGPSDGFTTLETGLDVRFPIQSFGGSRPSDWSAYVIRRRFLKALTFDQLNGETVELRNQNEIGVTLGFGRPIGFWLLKVSRVGLGVRFGERLSSVRILFGVPF